MIGGAKAAPAREAACVTPCKKPRIVGGNQVASARVATGNPPASPTPKSSRTMKNET